MDGPSSAPVADYAHTVICFLFRNKKVVGPMLQCMLSLPLRIVRIVPGASGHHENTAHAL